MVCCDFEGDFWCFGDVGVDLMVVSMGFLMVLLVVWVLAMLNLTKRLKANPIVVT